MFRKVVLPEDRAERLSVIMKGAGRRTAAGVATGYVGLVLIALAAFAPTFGHEAIRFVGTVFLLGIALGVVGLSLALTSVPTLLRTQ